MSHGTPLWFLGEDQKQAHVGREDHKPHPPGFAGSSVFVSYREYTRFYLMNVFLGKMKSNKTSLESHRLVVRKPSVEITSSPTNIL